MAIVTKKKPPGRNNFGRSKRAPEKPLVMSTPRRVTTAPRAHFGRAREPAKGEVPFIIRRADVVSRVGDCDLIAIFDLAAARAKGKAPAIPEQAGTNEKGDLVFENGWKDIHARRLMDHSPRALHLMAKNGLIPLSEREALAMILREGKPFDPPSIPMARVQRVDPSSSQTVAVMALDMASRRRRGALAPVEPLRKTRIEDPEED